MRIGVGWRLFSFLPEGGYYMVLWEGYQHQQCVGRRDGQSRSSKGIGAPLVIVWYGGGWKIATK